MLATLLALSVLGMPRPAAADGGATLRLPDVTIAPGTQFDVSLHLGGVSSPVYSIDLRIEYDAAHLGAVAVTKAGGTATWTLAVNIDTPGVIQAGLATGAQPLTAAGDILLITFTPLSASGTSALTLARGDLNEGVIPATLVHGAVTVRTAPRPVDDAYITAEDTRLTVAAPLGVLSNDQGDDPLTAALIDAPLSGILDLQMDGGFVYTPTLNFAGQDHFVYAAHDGTSAVVTATATITVTAVNDPPIAVAGGPYRVTEGDLLHLDASDSSDVDDMSTDLVFAWDLDDDGEFDDASGVTTTLPIPLYATSPMTATLAVQDRAGAVVTAAASITVDRVIRLPLPEAPAYGNIPDGDTQHTNLIVYTFAGRAGDVGITYAAWEIDAGEPVQIFVNDQHVGNIAPTIGWSKPVLLVVDDALVNDTDGNELAFIHGWNPPQLETWGVRDVRVLDTQVLAVAPGWNLFSTHIMPFDPSPQRFTIPPAVFTRVLGESGIYYEPLEPQFQSLHTVDAGRGYYGYAPIAVPVAVTVYGTMLPDAPLPLHLGWNWVGYLPRVPLPVSEALQSIDGSYLRTLSLSKVYVPGLPDGFSTLDELEPGQGYLIYMTEPGALVYPANTEAQ